MGPQPTRGKEVAHKACKDCGTVAEPSTKTPGSIGIELVLWLCFLVPGLIYSIWRLSARHDACPACGSKRIVPASTPDGQRIVSAAPVGSIAPARGAGAQSAGHAVGAMVGSLLRRR